MKNRHLPPQRRRPLAIVVASVWVVVAMADETGALPDPTEASATVPPVTYQEVLPSGASGYLQGIDAMRLPWPRLFDGDGRFAQELAAVPGTAPPPAPAHAGHSMTMTGMNSAVDSAPSADGRDARGVVHAVDVDTGRVTIKHGPIERLEMPGMTMVFRVKDKALLESIEPGAEVGFDVRIEGTVFYVTGFGK